MVATRVRAVVAVALVALSSAGCGLLDADAWSAQSPKPTEHAPTMTRSEVAAGVQAHAGEFAAWLGAPLSPGPQETIGTSASCSNWLDGARQMERTYVVPLPAGEQAAAFARVRAGMAGRGYEAWNDGAGSPGQFAVTMYTDSATKHGVRFYARPAGPERPVSDAVVVEVSSPCFTPVGSGS